VFVVKPVPVELKVEEFIQWLKVGKARPSEAAGLAEKSFKLVKPQAVYALVKVKNISNSQVQLESGQVLQSIILADILEEGQTVAPFAVTIGSRLEKEATEIKKTSLLRGWIVEQIGDYALMKASGYVKAQINRTLGGKVSSFSPGTGTGKLFGIEQQKVLFNVLDPYSHIRVHLTPSFLMVPRKSVSGIYAVTRQDYVACQYCPRERCQNRSRPFIGEYYSLSCEQQINSQ
jgi:hypothetical protein